MSRGGETEAAEVNPSPRGGHLKDSTFNQLEVATHLATGGVPFVIVFLWGLGREGVGFSPLGGPLFFTRLDHLRAPPFYHKK